MVYSKAEREFRLATEDWRAILFAQRRAINEVLDTLPDPLEDVIPSGWQALYENAHTSLLNMAADEAEAWNKVHLASQEYKTSTDLYKNATDLAKRLVNGTLTSEDVKFVCDAYNSQELLALRTSKDTDVIDKWKEKI